MATARRSGSLPDLQLTQLTRTRPFRWCALERALHRQPHVAYVSDPLERVFLEASAKNRPKRLRQGWRQRLHIDIGLHHRRQCE